MLGHGESSKSDQDRITTRNFSDPEVSLPILSDKHNKIIIIHYKESQKSSTASLQLRG